MGPRKILKWTGVKSRMGDLLIGKSNISKVRETMPTKNSRSAMTSENYKHNNPRLKTSGSNMEEALTSDLEENYFCETGLEDGTGCNAINSHDGNLDVHPSTYPNGCPKNYFIMLNKTNTQS